MPWDYEKIEKYFIFVIKIVFQVSKQKPFNNHNF